MILRAVATDGLPFEGPPSPEEEPGAFAGLPGERVRYWLARAMGLRLISDMYERAGDFGLGLPPGKRRKRRQAAIRQARALFVHIPKNAGQSVSMALYGLQVQHATIRYYQRAAPDIARLPSFAILRDPVDRFVSAYRYGRAGGAPDNQITPAFRDVYRGFRDVDDALDHVEQASSPYAVDHIFRPQAWYVTDGKGALAVDRLVDFTALDRIGSFVPQLGPGGIGMLNQGTRGPETLAPGQIARVERIYARDYALIAAARDMADSCWR
jgi:hypothetical protein